MAEQTPMTIEGPITNIFLTDNVVKFQVNNEIFIGFEKSNKAVTLLRDYVQDLGQVTIKLECPMPLKRTLDKQTHVNQIVLTNHTKIYLEDKLIFFPAEQSEDVALINDAIDYAIQQEKEQEQFAKKKKEIDEQVTTIEKELYPKLTQQKALTKKSDQPLALTAENIQTYLDPEKKCSKAEIGLFLVLCHEYNLNPFLKEIYLVKYGTKPATYIVSKDLFLKRVDTMTDFGGIDAGIFVEYEGKTEKRDGSFYNKKTEILLGGWAHVHRKDRITPPVSVSFDEYNSNQSSWLKMPSTMIRKVAIVQAIREAYPNYFAQLYDASEMGVELPTEE